MTPEFSDIVAKSVAPAESDTELTHARYTLHITNTLLAAITTTDPIRALAVQLASICHGAATIYDAEGTVVVSAGEAPARLIWNEVAASLRPQQEIEIGKWRVIARRVALSGETHVIALASRTHAVIERSGETVIDTAERILSMIHGLQYSAKLRERRDNEQLLATLQDGIPPSREHRLWSRLSQFHFSSYTDLIALEMAPVAAEAANETDLGTLIAHSRDHALPLLAGLRRADAGARATLSAVVPANQTAERVLERIARTNIIGISQPFSSLVEMPVATREAETALAIARKRTRAPGSGATVRMDRIDLATWLLSRVGESPLAERARRTLAPINDDETLVSTLVCFLSSGRNVARTAEHLFIHENTVRYRIGRVEESLGGSLSDAAFLTNVTLALYEEILSGRRDFSDEL